MFHLLAKCVPPRGGEYLLIERYRLRVRSYESRGMHREENIVANAAFRTVSTTNTDGPQHGFVSEAGAFRPAQEGTRCDGDRRSPVRCEEADRRAASCAPGRSSMRGGSDQLADRTGDHTADKVNTARRLFTRDPIHESTSCRFEKLWRQCYGMYRLMYSVAQTARSRGLRTLECRKASLWNRIGPAHRLRRVKVTCVGSGHRAAQAHSTKPSQQRQSVSS